MNDNQHIIKTVITTMVIMALMGFGTMCSTVLISLFYKVNPVEPTVLAAFTGAFTIVIGFLTGSLTKTTPTSNNPTETKITNTPEEPVPTTESKV